MTSHDRQLVLVAHGSSDPRWREPFEDLCRTLKQELGEQTVTLAYMEMAEPDLMTVIERSFSQGIRHFSILPLFMAAGGHVSTDIPHQATQAMAAHPEITLDLLPPAGEHPQVIAAISRIAADWAERRDAFIGETLKKA